MRRNKSDMYQRLLSPKVQENTFQFEFVPNYSDFSEPALSTVNEDDLQLIIDYS